MKTLLVVEVSPGLEFSVSRNLTAQFVEQWKMRKSPRSSITLEMAKCFTLYMVKRS